MIVSCSNSMWDQKEETLSLLLEHGEMDLGQLIHNRQATNPLRNDPLILMFLWQQMLNSVKVRMYVLLLLCAGLSFFI